MSESDPAILTVEYYAGRWTITEIAGAQYLGVIERASDGFTVLSIKRMGGQRAFNIQVGEVYAITLDGHRHVLKTPSERFRIRGQEIKLVVEGKRDDWSDPYFNPSSPKRYDRQPDYSLFTDHEHEAKRNRPKGTRVGPSRSTSGVEPGAGCAPILAAGLVAVWAAGQAFGLF